MLALGGRDIEAPILTKSDNAVGLPVAVVTDRGVN
jgi:hypothetical protein